MTKVRKVSWILFAVFWFQVSLPHALMGCPTCKDGLHDDGTAGAYAVSILLMMAMPFVILSFWVATIVRLRSKVAKRLPAFQPSGESG